MQALSKNEKNQMKYILLLLSFNAFAYDPPMTREELQRLGMLNKPTFTAQDDGPPFTDEEVLSLDKATPDRSSIPGTLKDPVNRPLAICKRLRKMCVPLKRRSCFCKHR